MTGPAGQRRGIPEATKILPLTFLVIVMTIVFYGLTAAVPAAAAPGVLRSPRSRPLLVGGEDWVIDLGRALQTAGLDVLMWAGLEDAARADPARPPCTWRPASCWPRSSPTAPSCRASRRCC